MSDICDIWKKQLLRPNFVQFRKKLKEQSFCGGLVKELETSVLATFLTSCVFSEKNSISNSLKIFTLSKKLFPDLLASLYNATKMFLKG